MANVTIKIPTTANPYEVWVNGVKYSYEAGKTVDVPEEVAVVIQQHIKALEEGLLPPAPGDGGSTALGGADWNAAEGEAGHVLNRTHWVEKGEVILPESKLEPFSFGALEGFALANYVPVELGKTYIVAYNGVDYECVSDTLADDILPVPALVLGDLNGDHEPPFSVACISEADISTAGFGVACMPFDGATSVTISIKEPDVVHKMDGKFLPDGLPYAGRGYGEVLPETTAEPDYADEGTAPGVLFEPVVELVDGEEYTVTWNGTEYKCKAQIMEDEGIVLQILGNLDLYFGEGDSGEPFALFFPTAESVAMTQCTALVYFYDGSTTATFSISGPTEIVHPLDKKFLPDLGSSGNAAMVVNLLLGDSGVAPDKRYDVIRAHIEAGGLAYVRLEYENSITLHQFSEATDTELKFRCPTISYPQLYLQTVTIDNVNAVTISSSVINIDSVD